MDTPTEENSKGERMKNSDRARVGLHPLLQFLNTTIVVSSFNKLFCKHAHRLLRVVLMLKDQYKQLALWTIFLMEGGVHINETWWVYFLNVPAQKFACKHSPFMHFQASVVVMLFVHTMYIYLGSLCSILYLGCHVWSAKSCKDMERGKDKTEWQAPLNCTIALSRICLTL